MLERLDWGSGPAEAPLTDEQLIRGAIVTAIVLSLECSAGLSDVLQLAPASTSTPSRSLPLPWRSKAPRLSPRDGCQLTKAPNSGRASMSPRPASAALRRSVRPKSAVRRTPQAWAARDEAL